MRLGFAGNDHLCCQFGYGRWAGADVVRARQTVPDGGGHLQGEDRRWREIPEQYSAKLTIEHAQLAVECRVDVVCIYGPDGRHAFRPTNEEYVRFFDTVLEAVRWPVSLCPNPTVGYTPDPRLVARIADRHPNVGAIVLTGHMLDDYFIALREALAREDVKIFATEPGSLNTLALGAAGLAGNLAGIIPKTYRRYLDAYQDGRIQDAALQYEQIRRLMAFVGKN